MKKISLGLAALGMMTAISCGNLDVVGKESVASFDKVLQQIPLALTADEMNGGWSLAAPDGQARFIWSSNYAASPLHDVMLEFDAAPFISAGLDPAKLPESIAFYEYEDKIMVGTKLGQDTFSAGTALAAYEFMVNKYRNIIGYHAALDHYGVNLSGGNLFEWAKDMTTNDKDIVFVLNPAPFLAAGVDPDKIAGWAFAKVTVDDENGKPVEVDKILKPFNLR
jgi:hypothetical protein